MRMTGGLRRRQRGLSLVEMMVGVAVGLVIVAGASMMIASQLADNRRLVVETQLQQDLRASIDIVTRELRRIGTEREQKALLGLASPAGAVEGDMSSRSPTTSGAAVESLTFYYDPKGDGNNFFGFRRRAAEAPNASAYVLQSRLGGAGWQDLTDPAVLDVTAFQITPRHGTAIRLPCSRPCPDTTSNCWPEITVRDLEVTMTARSRLDPTVERTLSSRVRLRNDFVDFKVSPTEICPS